MSHTTLFMRLLSRYLSTNLQTNIGRCKFFLRATQGILFPKSSFKFMKHARVHRNNDFYMNATMRKLQMPLQVEHRKFSLQKNTISLNEGVHGSVRAGPETERSGFGQTLCQSLHDINSWISPGNNESPGP